MRISPTAQAVLTVGKNSATAATISRKRGSSGKKRAKRGQPFKA